MDGLTDPTGMAADSREATTRKDKKEEEDCRHAPIQPARPALVTCCSILQYRPDCASCLLTAADYQDFLLHPRRCAEGFRDFRRFDTAVRALEIEIYRYHTALRRPG